MVLNRLCPTGTGRVLRADVARHRQHDWTVAIRQIADDADVAPVAETTRAPERAAKCIIDRQAERKQCRPRPIVGTYAVVPMVDERGENDLRNVVTASRELIENDVFAGDIRAIPIRRLLDVVEGA